MSTKQVLIHDMIDQELIQEIPNNIKEFYTNVGQSILKLIRKRGIRKYSSSHIDQWVRLRFPINEDAILVKKHEMAAKQVSKYLLRKTTDYKIPLNDVHAILELDKKIQEENKLEREKFNKIKAEVEVIRQQKRKMRKPRSKTITKKVKKKIVASRVIKKELAPSKILEGINYDFIYTNWMDHVETKSTSKSYWYIHEYIGRYVLNFAIERNASIINKKIVQDFLDSYGKGKAAKTMNHYTRVAKYFLEFCEALNR